MVPILSLPRAGRLKLLAGAVLTLLQRTPALRLAERAGEWVVAVPAGALLRPAAVAASALGAVQVLTGATPLVPSSGTASGLTVAAQSPVTIVYTVNGTATLPVSWTLGGTIPPGLNFSGLTAPGTVNVQTGQNPDGVLVLSGAATTAGTYNLTLEAWEFPDASGVGSDVFNYQIVVTPSAGGAPAFTTQPQDQTGTVGQSVSFTAAASGAPTYQWQFNGAAISGATSATFTLAHAQPSDAGTYAVTAANANGTTQSNNATLTLANAANGPVFTRQPVAQAIASGSTVVFSVQAGGSPAPTYRWYCDDTAIAGATGATLVVPAATAAQAGLYSCIAANSGGITPSDPANLTVSATNSPGHLVNLSVLSSIQGSLSMGFVVGGAGTSGSQTVLIRGVGPTLALPPFSVPAVMSDPILTVVRQNGAATIATNAGWGSPASNQTQVTAFDAAVGAFALPNPASLDSALVATLPISAGGYTAQVAGKTGDSGYALTEVYDATTAYTTASPRLVNLSCLTRVPASGSINVGFVLGGSTAKTVLIRVSGPTLAATPFNVPGTMPDPQLSVQPLSNATKVLAANASWGGDPQLAAVASAVGAFAFISPTSRDSAVMLTLQPATAYTVSASSVSGAGGLILVEVYDVP